MKRLIIETKDGSHTISIPEAQVTYHSLHGALRESQHIFIQAGLQYYISHNSSHSIRIFEMGFGTGLNAFLTAIEASERQIVINYSAIEKFPLTADEVAGLNFSSLPELSSSKGIMSALHDAVWDKETSIHSHFSLQKINGDLLSLPATLPPVDIIYFDAFAPSAQPELWTPSVFEKMKSIMIPGAILLTYCSKGDVRRAMKAAGLNVEKLAGPPGKREIVRAHNLA